MKTLLFCSRFYLPVTTGALRRIHRNFVLLAKAGYRVIVVTRGVASECEYELIEGIEIHRIRGANAEREASLIKHARQLWHEIGKPPGAGLVVLFPGGLHYTIELLKSRVCGLKTVCFLTIMPEVEGGRLLHARERLGGFFRYLVFQKVIVLSEEMRRAYLRRYWLFRHCCKVVPNGVDTDRFGPLKAEKRKRLREKSGFTEQDKIVLFVGSLVPRKRLSLIVDSWAQVLASHSDAKLVIVGAERTRATFQEGTLKKEFEDATAELYAKVESYERSGSVIIVDVTEAPEEYYQMADLFVLPSELEGMPNVLLEAMACGVAAIISDFAGRPRDGEEIGVEGIHYAACVRNNDEWGNSILKALSSGQTRAEIGRKAREFIVERHRLDQVIGELDRELQ